MGKQDMDRILIVDDNPAIHDDLKHVLGAGSSITLDAETVMLENELFSDSESVSPIPVPEVDTRYEIDDAFQGQEAFDMVEQAAIEGNPYAVIFMDVRMPPGIDGIQTIQNIWEKYPDIEMIICTAYSDYSWDQIVTKLGSTDQLLFMKKPFDSLTVKQTVLSLVKKWEQRQKNEDQLSGLENDIENRSKQLNNMIDQFRQLKKETEASTIVKRNFITNRSLQMQTPVNSIIGMSELLMDTDLNNEQRVYAEKIKLSGDSILTIVNDILDYSKIEAGKISLDEIEFNVRTLVENAVDLISAGAHEMGLEIGTLIYTDVPENVIGDPLRIRQILLNLLTNAVKFTEKGEILLSVFCADTSQGSDKVSLQFEVSDTGIGISEKEQENIFSPMAISVASVTHTYSSTGLGLAICKRLVALMNGQIGVFSVPGEGSTFWFTTVYEIEETPKYTRMHPSKSLRGMRCLIMSDSPTTWKVLSLHINQWGGKCFEASTLEEAIEQLHTALDTNPFGIMVIDFKDADIAYYQDIARNIKRHENLSSLRLICLSSNARRGDAGILKNAGYSAFLTKPIKQSHLYKCLLMIYGLREERCSLEDTGIVTKHFVDEFAPDSYRVLVVDDDTLNQRAIVYVLNRLRIRCDVAGNGKAAIDALAKKKYDLVLMDCQMPVLNGFEATQHIRESEDVVREIPVIAMTGDPVSNTKEKCQAAGMNAMIAKPIDMEKLITLLKRYLESNNLTDSDQVESQ